jgi:two-component system, NarL family, nitrate/nitrite response regulator NarL
MTAQVLLIDDHPAFRAGFGLILQQLPGGVRLHEAASLGQGLALLDGALHPDLVVYDWHLPDGGGLPGLMALLQWKPPLPVVVISGSDESAVALAAVSVGARDFVPKTAEAAEILARLSRVLHPAGETVRVTAGAPRLTQRQGEVLHLLAEGHPNKEIAALLGIAEPTVRDHVSELLAVLGARNRTEAVALATRHGLLRS